MLKWKIVDYIAVLIKWETRSIFARNCRAQNFTDHWPVMTYVRLPQKRESETWKQFCLERIEAKNRRR